MNISDSSECSDVYELLFECAHRDKSSVTLVSVSSNICFGEYLFVFEGGSQKSFTKQLGRIG